LRPDWFRGLLLQCAFPSAVGQVVVTHRVSTYLSHPCPYLLSQLLFLHLLIYFPSLVGKPLFSCVAFRSLIAVVGLLFCICCQPDTRPSILLHFTCPPRFLSDYPVLPLFCEESPHSIPCLSIRFCIAISSLRNHARPTLVAAGIFAGSPLQFHCHCLPRPLYP
jgi:hypothetical protein